MVSRIRFKEPYDVRISDVFFFFFKESKSKVSESLQAQHQNIQIHKAMKMDRKANEKITKCMCVCACAFALIEWDEQFECKSEYCESLQICMLANRNRFYRMQWKALKCYGKLNKSLLKINKQRSNWMQLKVCLLCEMPSTKNKLNNFMAWNRVILLVIAFQMHCHWILDLRKIHFSMSQKISVPS